MFTFHQNEMVQTAQKATANKSLFLREVEECNVPVAQWVKNSLQCGKHRRCRSYPWVGKIPWRRAWQPTPVFLPRESHGQRSLVSYSP